MLLRVRLVVEHEVLLVDVGLLEVGLGYGVEAIEATSRGCRSSGRRLRRRVGTHGRHAVHGETARIVVHHHHLIAATAAAHRGERIVTGGSKRCLLQLLLLVLLIVLLLLLVLVLLLILLLILFGKRRRADHLFGACARECGRGEVVGLLITLKTRSFSHYYGNVEKWNISIHKATQLYMFIKSMT